MHGLCGLGASSKVDATGHRRASIGHKGLGFKSVLEVTDEPAVYSRTHAFKLGARYARPAVDALWADLGRPPPRSVPSMRFPIAVACVGRALVRLRRRRLQHRVLLPLPGLARRRVERRGRRSAPAAAAHHCAVPQAPRDGRGARRAGRPSRQRARGSSSASASTRPRSAWAPSTGFRGSGVYRVSVASDDEAATFVVAHDADIAIGPNRVGLSGPAWEDVELTEVSVAALEPGSDVLPLTWRHFPRLPPDVRALSLPDARQRRVQHRPLPSARPRLAGSRRLQQPSRPRGRAARRRRAPARSSRHGAPRRSSPRSTGVTILPMRRRRPPSSCTQRSRDELALVPLLPTEAGPELTLAEAVLPAGRARRGRRGVPRRPGRRPRWEGRRFPAARFCIGRWATDRRRSRGARARRRPRASRSLREPARRGPVGVGRPRVGRLRARPRPRARSDASGTGPLATIANRPRGACTSASRCSPSDATTIAPSTGSRSARTPAFFPPRSARQDLPLRGLRFMCHALCWGALNQNERLTLLDERIKAWTSLFDVREFRFETVVQAAVLPALVLNPDQRRARAARDAPRPDTPWRPSASSPGGFAKPDRPLRYQRLQSDRALLNLSRLPVPCRTDEGERWLPAYRVYFGADWIGDQSVELRRRRRSGRRVRAARVRLPRLARAVRRTSRRTRSGPARQARIARPTSDEVEADEDADQAIETDEPDRWIAFLSWIGVNRALRPVHFHDVEDDATGWLTTRNLAQPARLGVPGPRRHVDRVRGQPRATALAARNDVDSRRCPTSTRPTTSTRSSRSSQAAKQRRRRRDRAGADGTPRPALVVVPRLRRLPGRARRARTSRRASARSRNGPWPRS